MLTASEATLLSCKARAKTVWYPVNELIKQAAEEGRCEVSLPKSHYVIEDLSWANNLLHLGYHIESSSGKIRISW